MLPFSVFARRIVSARKARRQRVTPCLQALEDRWLPSLTAGLFSPPRAVEGQAFHNVGVFNFSANPPGTVNDYTALVNLGNGQSVTLTGTASANGQIVATGGSGNYAVQLSYTYGEELTNQTFNVQVNGPGGASVAAHTTGASPSVSTFVDNTHGLSSPRGLAFDASGNLDVANGSANTILKVTPAGAVSTFVDNTHGLSQPHGLAFDGSGDLYVSNQLGNTILKVTPAGAVSTFVDSSHGLSSPYGLAFDRSGNLYVANANANTILKVTPAGAVSTFVDNTHGLNLPSGLAFDGGGNLYVINYGGNSIFKVTPAGGVSTFVDNTHGLSNAFGLAIDATDNLYVANFGHFNVLKVTPAGAVSTFVDDSQGLGFPHSLAFDRTGNLYVTDVIGSKISKVGPGGFFVVDARLTSGTLTTPNALEGQAFTNTRVFHFSDADPNGTASDYTARVSLGDGSTVTVTSTAGANGQIVANAGGGFDVLLSYTYMEELTNQPFSVRVSDAGGAALNVLSRISTFVDNTHGLSVPAGLAFDAAGNLYVASEGNNMIFKVTPAGAVSTFVDNSHGLNQPIGLAFDASGNLYVANSNSDTIFKVTPAGAVSTFVDNTHGLGHPYALAFDGSGNLYAANSSIGTISKVTSAGAVSTFVDNSHGLVFPDGLAFDAGGNLFVASRGTDSILQVTPAGAVSTVVDGSQGLSGPYGLAFDRSGRLYAASFFGNTISTVTPARVTVTDADLMAGALTPPSASEGQAFRNVTVFHFTDADPNGTAGDYTALVNLGDGRSVTLTGTAGANGQIVAHAGGGFDVQLSYTYMEELTNQQFNVQVTDAGGSSTGRSTGVSTFVDDTHGLSLPYGLAFDAGGNLFVTNSHTNTVSKVTPAGAVSTFVDNTHGLNAPQGLAFDASGNLYVASFTGGTISKVTPAGAVSTFVDNTHGLNHPSGLAFDRSGNLYVASAIGNMIFKVTPAGAVSTFVDNTHGLNLPQTEAFDAAGNLYVACAGNDMIFKVTPAGAVSTFVDNTHRLAGPTGLAFDSGGNLYVANDNNMSISKVTPAGTVTANPSATASEYTAVVDLGDGNSVTLTSTPGANGQIVANPGGGFDVQLSYTYAEEFSNLTLSFQVRDAGGASLSAVARLSAFVEDFQGLTAPNGLAIDASGNLYVAHTLSNTITKVTPAGEVSIFVDDTHGLDGPAGLAFDASGNLYVTNFTGNTIFKVTPAGDVSTFVDATHGLNGPAYLAFDAVGNLYVSNQLGNTIFQVTPAGAVSTFVDDTHGLNNPIGLAFDAGGNLFVANAGDNTILMVTPAGAVSTFVDNSHGLNVPHGLAFDASGNLYVANLQGNTVFQVTPAGAVSTFVDANQGLDHPAGLAFGADGSLYVSNFNGSTISKSADVADAAVSATGMFTVTGTEGADTGVQTVATFTDPAGPEDVSEYSALIDWGDGSDLSAGIISYDANQNLFIVSGAHVYAAEGNYTITITIAHGTAVDVTVTSTATVTDPALVAGDAITFAATTGQPFDGQAVATFTDPGGSEDVGNYTALIDWGDGSQPEPGTISYDPATDSFTVAGSHTYSSSGTYTVTVTVMHGAADDLVVLAEADVTDGGPGPRSSARRGVLPSNSGARPVVDRVFLPDQVTLWLDAAGAREPRAAGLPMAGGWNSSAARAEHQGVPVMDRMTDWQPVAPASATHRLVPREGVASDVLWPGKPGDLGYPGLS